MSKITHYITQNNKKVHDIYAIDDNHNIIGRKHTAIMDSSKALNNNRLYYYYGGPYYGNKDWDPNYPIYNTSNKLNPAMVKINMSFPVSASSHSSYISAGVVPEAIYFSAGNSILRSTGNVICFSSDESTSHTGKTNIWLRTENWHLKLDISYNGSTKTYDLGILDSSNPKFAIWIFNNTDRVRVNYKINNDVNNETEDTPGETISGFTLDLISSLHDGSGVLYYHDYGLSYTANDTHGCGVVYSYI